VNAVAKPEKAAPVLENIKLRFTDGSGKALLAA
jgi:hypothetical protein